MARHRRAQRTPAVRAKLRLRPGIERKIAHLKAHGLGQARYRRRPKVLLQARLTATMVNLQRLFVLGAFAPEGPGCAA